MLISYDKLFSLQGRQVTATQQQLVHVILTIYSLFLWLSGLYLSYAETIADCSMLSPVHTES